MAKMVGLSRNLKMSWLNKAAELAGQGLSEEEFKAQLNEYLGYEIESPTNLRKTREILMNVWAYDSVIPAEIHNEAVKLFKQYPDYALEIHWCLLLLAYPVFVDINSLIGKISEFQDEITLAQLKQKMFDEWGERTTLFHSTDKIIATLKSIEALSCDKPGKYRVQKYDVKPAKVVLFMVYVLMKVDESSYHTFQSLNSAAFFYPFHYQVDKMDIMDDGRFELSNFGGELTVTLKE